MTSLDRQLLRGIWLAVFVLLATVSLAHAQAGTFNGRVLDQGDAVLPGVTVTATNASTGVARTTVTNAEGGYFMPGLEPGTYEVKTELTGFAPAARERVILGVNATLTLDFKMSVASLNETLTVTGESPIIEVTQSKVASTIQANELENLPMITRSVSGMLALLPGRGADGADTSQQGERRQRLVRRRVGHQCHPVVDGADNRDNRYGGPLLTFTTESLEQFQLATSQFTAADGRTGGAALTMVTKSGTNQFHGSAFLFARDRSLTAKDYFSKAGNQEKPPFNRKQYGGSIGGPIVHNRMFFFGALEQVKENTAIPVPDDLYNQLQLLVPLGLAYPNHPHAGPIPGRLSLYTVKTNLQLTNTQSVMGRFAGQRDQRDAVTFNVRNDLREPENSLIKMWSGVGQHSWVMGNRGLNQFTAQVNHLYRLSDVTSAVSGLHYTRDFPNVPVFSNPPSLSFPSVTVGAGGAGGSLTDTYVIEFKDDISQLRGNHALKTGVDFKNLPKLGLLNANEHFPTVTFFDDPSVILSNSNGRYPQGLATPGVARQWQQANPVRSEDINEGAKQFSTWFQDDWRATPQADIEPRRPLRHRLQLLRSAEHRQQRHAAGAAGDRQHELQRRSEDPDQGHFSSCRVCLGPVGQRHARAARRLRALFRSVQHRRRRRRLGPEQAAVERARDADQHDLRGRPARDLQVRRRPASGAAERSQLTAARRGGRVSGARHHRSVQPPGAHRLRASARAEHRRHSRLHPRRRAARVPAHQPESDRQRHALSSRRISHECTEFPTCSTRSTSSSRTTSRATTR
jgi:hypothetical protein